MKKIFKAVSCCVLALGFTACGLGDGSANSENTGNSSVGNVSFDDATKTKITIYVDASNIYGTYIKGSDENYVKETIERKFYEDTGYAVDFNIQYCSHSTFSTQFTGVMTSGRWDAAVSYLGQAGLDEVALNQDIALDLSDLIDSYGENILEAIDKEAMWATTLIDGTVIGIPSVANTKTKGILVRKDLMNQVGYTSEAGHNDDLGATSELANGKLKTLQTIDDFTDMLRRLKHQGICSNPLVGNAYDIEFTLTPGALNCLGYQYKDVIYNADGSVKEVVPGWLSENYDDVLAMEYMWQREGLWEADNTVKTTEQRIADLTNNKAAVYCVDPDILSLIDVARQVKAANPDAEFEVIKPLDGVDENGDAIEGSGAFAEASRTTDCLIVNKKSQNARIIVEYFNWLYSDVENYELCAYGIEGEHWVDAGEGYYAYPEGKAEKYLTKPPYSGVFALLHNDEYAYRLYDGYSAEEKAWISIVQNSRTMKNETDGMLFYNMTATMGNNFQTAENEFYPTVALKAWDASVDPAKSYENGVTKYRNQAGDYIGWLTEQYKLYVAKRAQ